MRTSQRITLLTLVALALAAAAFAALFTALDRANGNVAIDFYGRVKDENCAAVPNAVVTGYVARVASLHVPVPFTTSTRREPFHTTTDAAGNFTVHGLRGVTLYFEKIESGDYTVELRGLYAFDYGSFPGSPPPHRPDPAHPVEFPAHKRKPVR